MHAALFETHLVPKERARDVNLFAAHNHNFLAVQDLLGDNGGQSTKEMTLAINYDGCRRESRHGLGLRILGIS